MSFLSVRNLHVSVGGKPILKGLDLEVGKGEVHAVMGPNGSGKSTLSYVLAGREGYEVTEGQVLFMGEDLTQLGPHERAAAGIFLAFQYPVEIPACQGLPSSRRPSMLFARRMASRNWMPSRFSGWPARKVNCSG